MGFFDKEPALGISNPSRGVSEAVTSAADQKASGKITNYSTRDNWGGWKKDSIYSELRKTKDLSRQVYNELIQKIYLAYRSNPIIFRSSEMIAEFIVGDEGIQYKTDNKFVKQILDLHWLNPVNNWTLLQHDRLRDLGLFGELCIPIDINPENGAVALGNIDTEFIEDVVYDEVVQMRPSSVVIKSTVGDEKYKRVYKIISEADLELLDETSQIERGRLVGLKTDKVKGFGFKKGDVVDKKYLPKKTTGQLHDTSNVYKWQGACFYFSINNPITSSRGLSDFTSILDWSELHDEYMFGSAGKALRSGLSFVDITIKGATQKKIDEYIANNPEPEPGGRIVHNEQVEVKVVTPDLKTDQVRDLGELLKNHQLAGVGLAPHWFSEASAARAVAPEMNEPTFKHFRQRQRTFAYILAYIFRFVIDQAIIHNRLRAPNDADYYLIFPQMSRRDHSINGRAIKDFAAALSDAVKQDYLVPKVAHELLRRYIKLLNIEIGKDQPRVNAKDEELPKYRDKPLSQLKPRNNQNNQGNQNGNQNGNQPVNKDDKPKDDKAKDDKESIIEIKENEMKRDNERVAQQLKVRGFMIDNETSESNGIYRFIANPPGFESVLFANLREEYKMSAEDEKNLKDTMEIKSESKAKNE